MKKCIICRKNRVEFSDEHVIPDSINGYYHIYTVCKPCNSKLGQNIDEPLTNHKFMEFQRYIMRIPGKKGIMPHPFDGINYFKGDEDTKVKLQQDKMGKITPYILPDIPRNSLDNSFSITLDKKDEKNMDKIINKILQRNGIPKENVSIVRNENKLIDKPIEVNLSIDTKKFKMGLLKIGYEFATENIKHYFLKDVKARTISNLLYKADFDGLDNHNLFIGNGLQKEVMIPFESLINPKEDFHYLILTSVKDLGLVCFINLFSTFFIGIHLSNKEYDIPNSMIIGINDTHEKKFKIVCPLEIVDTCYVEAPLRFVYEFNNQFEELDFYKAEKEGNINLYILNGHIPLFYKNGEIAYTNCADKLKQRQLIKNDLGNFKNYIITNHILDEELYVKILPSEKLFKVAEINIELERIKDHI
ncbi:HNH endonuclease [Bacillus sp. JKS001846]|uniref:HNH endonuclease n=1 Tax=Bacillus sp. JKS001846 TaxID=1938743 RepID=UPI0009D87335|nr:HNH endonuclease [Bacillus sp. JKS001846]SMD41420.1 HNH endonuclease [Bacillus sp. JKS001846]